jgi:L-aminopeptidase/D-esterase-like protein
MGPSNIDAFKFFSPVFVSKVKNLTTLTLAVIAFFGALLVAQSGNASGGACESRFAGRTEKFQKTRAEVEEFKFNMPGVKIGTVTDPSMATGATLFLFGKGVTANFDSRGGSVAAVETTLLEESSYSNEIDGILFAGGSTMGLEATQGVRRRLFDANASQAGEFDFIPSVPGAVVYDYGARLEPQQQKLFFPNMEMGKAAYDVARENSILIGRVGAGTTTTANKISAPIWGGQGAAFHEFVLENGKTVKIFAAVVLNASGDITLPAGHALDERALKKLRAIQVRRGHKQNTTLSIVITDVSLDRSQLKRLAVMVHTSMGSMIHPFHSYTDGDILFAVSLHQSKVSDLGVDPFELEEKMQLGASKLMQDAILKSVTIANSRGLPVIESKEEKK